MPEAFTDTSIAAFINLAHYPITTRDSDAYREVVARGRGDLARQGSLALPGFLSPEGLEKLTHAAAVLGPKAFLSEKSNNPYNAPVSEETPPGHPYRIMAPSRRHGVAYHDMRDTPLGALYRWEPLRALVADLLEKPKLYLHDDPSNALVLQIYKPGSRLAWHFDRANFSTILQLQSAEAGGFFECVPNLRRSDDECFADVAEVLRGKRDRVQQKRSKAGSFVIIFGRHTLHRVTEVEGGRDRLSLVLSYEEAPGQKLDLATRRLFFGPTAPADPV